MHNSGALAVADAVPQETSALRDPLPILLAAGGDDRLAVDPLSGFNAYGCSPRPRGGVIAFSSSTASTISEQAFAHIQRARDMLSRDCAARGLFDAFDARGEELRRSLRSCLRLNGSGAEIVFSPSGTDTQLHALFFARGLLGAPVTSIVVGADQTGSGTAYTSRGRHFSTRTAQGRAVEKGAQVEGLADGVDSIAISLFADDGAVCTPAQTDAAVVEAVAEEIAAGRKVVLQGMDSSKLGWRAPSDACLRHLGARWPRDLLIVIDACQMRIGRPRLAEYLARGYIVLITGSKFFNGPAFSGASLYPADLADRIAAWNTMPEGLADYATRFDLPRRWFAARGALRVAPNIGQWFRWEAALEEMRAYYALPLAYRRSVLARLAEAVPALAAASRTLEMLLEQGGTDADDEMPASTIFPFLVKSGGHLLAHDDMAALYRALNRDVSAALPATASDEERALAATPCHIGQPVKLPAAGGGSKTVLRIGIGARTISESWSADDATAERNVRGIVGRIGAVVRKIDLIVGCGAYRAVTP